MPRAIRVSIDPTIAASLGPEVHWTVRTALSSAGFPWEEVAPGEACEIAYGATPPAAGAARHVRFDAALWERRRSLVLAHAAPDGTLAFGGMPAGDGEPDLFFALYWLLSGEGERGLPRGKHGYFSLDAHPAWKDEVLRTAPASALVERIVRGLPGEPLPRWPGGAAVAASLSHDVDYPEVVRWLEPVRVLRRGRGLGTAMAVARGQLHHWHIPSWMELEASLSIRSSFHFVGRKGSLRQYAAGVPDPFYDVASPRFRELLARLRNGGWEIAMHASYLAYESEEGFRAEKRRIEEAGEAPVRGCRHHYWHLDPEDPDATLALHERVGLEYDATIGHNRHLGWRRGLALPWYPFHRERRRQLATLQIPTAWMDDQLFGYARHNPGDRDALLGSLADVAYAHRGCLLADVHDYVFDDRLFPGWLATFRRFWESLRARGSVWFATPHEIARHWGERYRALRAESRGLALGET